MQEHPPSEPLLFFSNVSKRREKGGVCFELQVPRLIVRRGEFLAVIGPSGCGKSTLLDFMGLVLKPDQYQECRLAYEGRLVDVGRLPESGLAALRRSELGYVLQAGGLLPYLTVADNILLPARLNGYSPKIARKTLAALAGRLGIGEQLNKKPAHLSGGQRQRAAIARALIHRPRLVLADEPTAAVDLPTAREISLVFKELVRSLGVSLVVVTHDVALVKNLADRFIGFQVKKVSADHTRSVVGEVSGG